MPIHVTNIIIICNIVSILTIFFAKYFVFCPQPHHPKNSNIPYWYCLQCTPSLTLPPSSLKCLQKSNPNSHRKCFRCFKCFGCFRCFMFAFGPQNRPILVQIRTNPANRPNRPTAISWLRKTPKKAIHPLVYEHDTALFVIAAVLFRRSGFFSGGEAAKRGGKPAIGDGISWATPCKRSRSLKRSLETAAARVMSLGGSVVAKVSDYTQASVSDSSEVPSHCCP